jgi:hypothetical protein
MAAHAIAGNEQGRGIRDLGADAILVVLARTHEAELSMFNAQATTVPFG